MVQLAPLRGLTPVGDVRVRSVDGALGSTARLARRGRHPRHVAWLESDGRPAPGRLADWLAAGDVVLDDRPRLRWVEQHLPDGHVVGGVLGAVPLADLVLHEQVDPVAVRRRVRRDEQQQAELRPVLAVLERHDDRLAAVGRRARRLPALLDVLDDLGTRHVVRLLPDELAAAAVAAASPSRALLADGHHRVAAAVAMGRGRLPALVTLAGQAPRLLPVWRLVVTAAGADVLRAHLAVAADPHGPVVASWGRQRTRWPARPDELPVVAAARLAAATPGLVRISTTADPAAAAVAERDGAVVLGAPAPSVPEVLEHLRRRGPLPPKSTSFHPKPRVGLTIVPSTDLLDRLG